MNEKIKQHVINYCKSNGFTTYDEDLIEIITESKRVHTEIGAAHRWYDEMFVVVELDGMLIGYDWYHVTGDTSISDMDLELNVESICEVQKVEKTIFVYEKVK